MKIAEYDFRPILIEIVKTFRGPLSMFCRYPADDLPDTRPATPRSTDVHTDKSAGDLRPTPIEERSSDTRDI